MDALATLASIVEILEGVWTQPLEIEQKYQLVHNEKEDLAILAIKKEKVPWFYDIMKFLELGIYPDRAKKKKRCLVRMMAMQYILCRVSFIGDPIMGYIFVV